MREEIPTFGVILRAAYHFLRRILLRAQWWTVDIWETIHRPSGTRFPPAKLRYKIGESVRRSNFREVGRRTVDNLRRTLATIGFDLRSEMAVLDFGCGCGRTLIFISALSPDANWFGTDVDEEAIVWCRRHFPRITFTVNEANPPLAFPGASFDLIYAVSVFTHLNAISSHG